MKKSLLPILFAGVSAFLGLTFFVSPSFAQTAPLGYWDFEGIPSGTAVPNLGSAGDQWNGVWIPFGGASLSDALVATPWGTGLQVNNTLGRLELPIFSSESFTVETWVKSTNPDNSQQWSGESAMISSRGPYGMILHPWNYSRNIAGYVFDSSGNYHQIGATKNTFADISQWHHYALTYDSATGYAALYLDGRPVQTATSGLSRQLEPEPGTNRNQILYVGQDGLDANRIMNGIFDEIRYYDSALSMRDIQTGFLERFHQTLPSRGVTVGRFFSYTDLDLSTSNGTFEYAVNLGTWGDNPKQVGEVTFMTEDGSPRPISFPSGFSTAGWGTQPVLESDPNGYNETLAEMCRTIRYVPSDASGRMVLSVTPGQTYQLQLIATSTDGADRTFSLSLGGKRVLDEFRPISVQAYEGGNLINGVVITYEFMPMSDTFVIEGFKGTLGEHSPNEPVFNALTLKALNDKPLAIPLTGLGDLNLNQGTVVYAVNLNGGPITIGGVPFLGDPGGPIASLYEGDVTVKAVAGADAGWASLDGRAPKTSDLKLNELLSSVRYDPAGVELGLTVTSGKNYELDLLFHEIANVGVRYFDVFMDDMLLVEGFDVAAIGQDAMLTIPFQASDDSIKFLLSRVAGDPLLAGFVLRDMTDDSVPEPAAWGMLLLGAAVMIVCRRRRVGF